MRWQQTSCHAAWRELISSFGQLSSYFLDKNPQSVVWWKHRFYCLKSPLFIPQALIFQTRNSSNVGCIIEAEPIMVSTKLAEPFMKWAQYPLTGRLPKHCGPFYQCTSSNNSQVLILALIISLICQKDQKVQLLLCTSFKYIKRLCVSLPCVPQT